MVFVHETLTLVDMEALATTHVYRLRFPALSVAIDPEWKRLAVLTANGLRMWEILMDEPEYLYGGKRP